MQSQAIDSVSSPEDFEIDAANESEDQLQIQKQHDEPGGSTPFASQPPKPPTPTQKRRRVTRACDECRRKKIKCDGKQPCTHCTVYSYGQYSL